MVVAAGQFVRLTRAGSFLVTSEREKRAELADYSFADGPKPLSRK